MPSQSYEAQLTPEKLNQLHTGLSEPGPSMLKIQATALSWRHGFKAGFGMSTWPKDGGGPPLLHPTTNAQPLESEDPPNAA